MPKMTHWRTPNDVIDMASDKAAVYAAQGWVSTDAKTPKVQPATAMTTEAVNEPPAETPLEPQPAKKAVAKKATKKVVKKS